MGGGGRARRIACFQKAEPQDKGKIDAMRDIVIEIDPEYKEGKYYVGVS